MRIGIFVVMAGREAGGPETYEIGLVRALASLDRTNEYTIFCLGDEAKVSFGLHQENFRFHVLRPSLRALSVPVGLPAALLRTQIPFYHATYIPPPFSPREYLFTLHDISMFVNPEFYHRPLLWRLAPLVRRGIEKARLLLCISEHTRDQVADRFHVPAERLAVVYHGLGEHLKPVPPSLAREHLQVAYGLKEPYVLFVGQLKTRSKNLIRLLEAFQLFQRELRTPCRLVLVGRRNRTTVGLDEAYHRLGLGGDVLELGHVPDADLPLLYSGAEMLVFPSLCEGFGFPVIEAMACGTPVVTSNVSCLPEVAGGAAVLVNPHSVEEIAEGILRVHRDATLRDTLRAKGLERARFFSWQRTAQQTREAYQRAAAW